MNSECAPHSDLRLQDLYNSLASSLIWMSFPPAQQDLKQHVPTKTTTILSNMEQPVEFLRQAREVHHASTSRKELEYLSRLPRPLIRAQAVLRGTRCTLAPNAAGSVSLAIETAEPRIPPGLQWSDHRSMGGILRGVQARCGNSTLPGQNPISLLKHGQGKPPSMAAHVVQAHEAMHQEWQEARIREQKERLAALRSHDLAAYMQLLRSTRDEQLDGLLRQTDDCLRSLAARLAPTLQHLERRKPDQALPEMSESSEGSTLEAAALPKPSVAGIASLAESTHMWNELSERIPANIAEQPSTLVGGSLHSYQLRGLCWLVGMRRAGLNGILADDMGLGKTVQVIAYMLQVRAEQGACVPSPPFLIAVPASVLSHWAGEIRRWAPSLELLLYAGPAVKREEALVRSILPAARGKVRIDVVLTTHDVLAGKTDAPRLRRLEYEALVVDEGHRLKNAACKLHAHLRAYRCRQRLLLTGTPLHNNLGELWALLNFLLPALFNSDDDFQTWFGGLMRTKLGASPDAGATADQTSAALLSEEETLLVASRLHQVLRPFMLRRLRSVVAAELPPKREVLLKCLPSPYQKALLHLLSSGIDKGQARCSNSLMEMRNICNHPFISALHVPGAEASLPPHPAGLPPEVSLCAKVELLDRCLWRLWAGGHRVLLFSTMTGALDVLQDYLDWRGFSWLRLDGNTGAEERADSIERFNAPESSVFVFLLSIRAGGVGLNLQTADTVVMYDTDWNAQIDLQAQARAHRLGQTKPVLVVRLLTEGTVEERIASVADAKRSAADVSITCGFFDGVTTSAERTEQLLAHVAASASETGLCQHSISCGPGRGDELDALLMRTPDERGLFRAAAEARRAAEGRYSEEHDAAASRLADEAAVAALVARAEQQYLVQDPDEGKEFGRGKRARVSTAYRVV